MDKESSKKKINTLKKNLTMIDLFNTEKGDKILKLKFPEEDFDDDYDTFLVLAKSMQLYEPERTYGESELVMFDAFYKHKVVDMKTCKNPKTPWNFRKDNLEGSEVKVLDGYSYVKRIFPNSTKVEDLSDTMTKEELEINYAYENKFLKIGDDQEVEYGDGGNLLLVTPLYFILNNFL